MASKNISSNLNVGDKNRKKQTEFPKKHGSPARWPSCSLQQDEAFLDSVIADCTDEPPEAQRVGWVMMDGCFLGWWFC